MNIDAPSSLPSPRAGRPLPWLLIIGLASLALLWPLTAMWQVGQGAPRALAVFGITAAVWIGAVGFGRVRRPVLTLAVAGLLHGFTGLVLSGFLSDTGGPFGDPVRLWIFLPALAMNTGVGALLGLAALGVQSALRARTAAPAVPEEDS